MTLLTLSHIAKTFENGVAAIADADFQIGHGQFVSLLGPSGCGKSTLLRIVAGLATPSAGTLTVTTSDIGFVFQDATLMPWTDALANARLPLDLQKVSRAQANAQAADALARVGLSGFEKAYPRQLSGGMKMRVSIARALASKPELLLLDEPFAALDEITRAALNDDLLRLARESGITMLFVTHSVAESCYLSDRVLVMSPRPGRIVADLALDQPDVRGSDFRLSPRYLDHQARVFSALSQAMAA